MGRRGWRMSFVKCRLLWIIRVKSQGRYNRNFPHRWNRGTNSEWPELIHATQKESTSPNPRWKRSNLPDSITQITNNAVVLRIKNGEDIGLMLSSEQRTECALWRLRTFFPKKKANRMLRMSHSNSFWSACTVTGLAIKTEPVTLHAGKIFSPKLLGTLNRNPK